MRNEGVTVAAGVQTVWLGVLDYLDEIDADLPDLKRITIGGSKCPETLIERMETRLGVRVQTSWGMTELSPLGTSAPADAPINTRASGRPPIGLDLKLTDANGAALPRQRGVVGHLKVKGASVIDRYYKSDSSALDAEGYFDTGDLASIDEDGNVAICGRSKDLIKSGGEWINPAEIEDIVGAHASVSQVAVIAREDAKWGERPVLIVEPRQGHAVDAQTLLRLLRGNIPDWWLPDQIVQVRAMPLAATGKIDKKQLRADYVDGRIATEGVNR
jgi:fatty-acyl-CoA synthase